MFVNKANFKKLVKEAYEGPGVHIEFSDNRYYLSGGYWMAMLPDAFLDKEVRAKLIEIVGKLPMDGESFTYHKKDDPQTLILGAFKVDLWEEYEKAKETLTKSRVSLDTDSQTLYMYQTSKNDNVYIPGVFQSILGEPTGQEECVKEPRLNGKLAYFVSDRMALRVLIHDPRFLGEQTLLEQLSGIDLHYDQWEGERIGE